MKLIKRFPAFMVCLLVASVMQAQFMDFGTDPSRFRWSRVKLPHYQLIYPQGSDSMAYYYALYLENVYPHLSKTIGKPVDVKFPVILHPGSMSSNGMVSWAPRRMELIPTPAAGSLSMQSFDKHLVLHESRHVFQTGKIMHGVFKPLYYLVGEQSAGVAAVLVPRWFFEGDAVSTETAMSNGGRGRLPEFNMAYRTQILGTGKNYSFDKWLLGSYKDYTGDFYALGYDMASYARYRYGGDIWDKTTSRFVKYPWFSKSFKHFTGSGIDGLYKQTFTYLEGEWNRVGQNQLAPAYHTPESKNYTSYRYPQVMNDSTIVAVKSGMKDLSSLVMVTHGREKHLVYVGHLNSRIHLRDERIYWTEIVPSLRWSLENYSVVKSYDLNKGQTTTITPKQRYLSLAVREQGPMAAVSRFSIKGDNKVVLLDLDEGEEVAEYPVPGNAFVKELAFGEGDNVIAVAVTGTGLDLLQLDTRTGEWTELLSTVSLNITSPVWIPQWKAGKIYFESGANGINNIYSFNPADSQIHRLTSSRFGAFDPSVSAKDGRLFFSDYQSQGYRVASLSVDSLLDEKADFSKPFVAPFVETLTAQEQFNLDSARLDSIDFQPERYRKLPHTFNIHSWAPFYYDVAEAMNTSASDLSTIVKPGATILSQNTLGTAIMQAGWYYGDGYHHGKLSFTYQGWFPVLNLAADYGGKAFDMFWGTNAAGQSGMQGRYANRNQLEAEARLYLPFNLTGREYIRGIQPSLTYYFTNNRYQQYNSGEFRYFQYLLPELRFYSYRKLAKRDILPRLGYQVRLQYLNSPFNSENYGSLYAARLTTYWPGILRNHGLMLRGGYQYQELGDKHLYLPEQLLDTPRGYNYLYQTRQQWTLKADYAFPIFCPDWNIGSLMYIKRLRANAFYDFTQNQAGKESGWMTQSSYGVDLNVDWNVFRLTYPITTGVRLVQPIDYGRFQAEMLFSVSF